MVSISNIDPRAAAAASPNKAHAQDSPKIREEKKKREMERENAAMGNLIKPHEHKKGTISEGPENKTHTDSPSHR